ncbi:hypothetical protein [Desnuesiella massiliensis]|uniref:hypothetical protein n=1 Tax=Desnuesiella massiliensis TaxID=1650662 RepID=UPI0006E3A84C|nr:hypothetical protein [Desnuesiella massiliensis]
MEFLLIIAFIVFIVVMLIVQGERHERKIREQISSIGGEVISIERKTFSTGPFFLVGKGRTVYRIEYRRGNEIKEGWVKFGDLFGPDWRL